MTQEYEHSPEDQSKEHLDADQQNQSAAEPELAAQTPDQVIADLNQKLAEMQDNYLRAKAEGENIRRRAVEDISKAHKFAIEGFAENLVPVTDSLYAALNAEAIDAKAFKEGLEITLKQLLSAFEKARMAEINPAVGDKFDPHHHQAIASVPSEQEANTVVSVLQRGYSISERVLRPALVMVSAAK